MSLWYSINLYLQSDPTQYFNGYFNVDPITNILIGFYGNNCLNTLLTGGEEVIDPLSIAQPFDGFPVYAYPTVESGIVYFDNAFRNTWNQFDSNGIVFPNFLTNVPGYDINTYDVITLFSNDPFSTTSFLIPTVLATGASPIDSSYNFTGLVVTTNIQSISAPNQIISCFNDNKQMSTTSSLFKKVGSSDYIAYKKQAAISAETKTPVKKNGMVYNKNFTFFPIINNANVNSKVNCIASAKSYDLLHDYTTGQKNTTILCANNQ
jgi:hypothetical protein